MLRWPDIRLTMDSSGMAGNTFIFWHKATTRFNIPDYYDHYVSYQIFRHHPYSPSKCQEYFLRVCYNLQEKMKKSKPITPLFSTNNRDLSTDDLKHFYHKELNRLYSNKKLRKNILQLGPSYRDNCDYQTQKDIFYKIMSLHIEEAAITLAMLLTEGINKHISILEIGGGLGLAYGYLKAKGYNICSFEPSEEEFSGHYETSKLLLQTLRINCANCYSFKAEEAHKLGKTFDVIASHEVLQYIDSLTTIFSNLKIVLNPNGIMIHRTVNYAIPYEPHFRILLLPFFPKTTSNILPSLKKKSALWKRLHFHTYDEVIKSAKENNLSITFKNITYETFKRLEEDPAFALRHKLLTSLYIMLKRSNLLGIVKLLPVKYLTPMQFTLHHNK
jgi:2-polyprenyl-3-methyl-5-hydroxy-6-metoxy-1,4-benzoquinol methylase